MRGGCLLLLYYLFIYLFIIIIIIISIIIIIIIIIIISFFDTKHFAREANPYRGFLGRNAYTRGTEHL